MLFGARLARMSVAEIENLTQARQADCESSLYQGVLFTHARPVPSLLPGDQQQSDEAARSLMMIGGMALHRYQTMSPT